MEGLGVGSRVKTSVIWHWCCCSRAQTDCTRSVLWERGLRPVSKEHGLEIIERIEPEYNISFNEAKNR